MIDVSDKDVKMAQENYMLAVRNGNKEQIEATKLMLDIVTSHLNQKNHQKNHEINQNNP